MRYASAAALYLGAFMGVPQFPILLPMREPGNVRWVSSGEDAYRGPHP